MEVLQPLAAATWASVPLAIRFATEDGNTEDLRLPVAAAPPARASGPHCH